MNWYDFETKLNLGVTLFKNELALGFSLRNLLHLRTTLRFIPTVWVTVTVALLSRIINIMNKKSKWIVIEPLCV